MDKKKQLEEEVAHLLTEGEMETRDPEEAAVDRLPAKYEVRIQTIQDPIVEETKIYRRLAEEIDDRYDNYMKKQNNQQRGEDMEKRNNPHHNSEKTHQKHPDVLQSLNENYDSVTDEKDHKTGRIESTNVYELEYRDKKE